jgi:hypothetical protein
MKIKKVLGLLTVMVAVFAIALPATAADPCSICKGCPLENIRCGEEEQGEDTCDYFDFETRNGYCDEGTEDDCRVIFDICECEDVTEVFASGRMTILTEGVYWTNVSDGADPGEVAFDMYANKDSACDAAFQTKSFGAVSYFLDEDGDDEGIPNDEVSGNCSVPDDQKVVMLSSESGSGYPITATDETDKLHQWWIDIPSMVYDLDEITRGDVVSVKIELLNEVIGGICAECVSICECTVDIGIMCCEEEEVSYSMYFPYVITQNATWFTGIVVTNLSSAVDIADMEATFTLTDSTGSTFTNTKTDFDAKVWAFSLDAELPNFSGTPAVGAAWLKVETNFSVDGYQFLTDGVFGAGTLPRVY